MVKSILFVDDEEHILKALRHLFAQTDYKIFFARSGLGALAILAQEKIHLIISDMRMPEMSGHQLLKEVRVKYPATMRVMLSAYAEEMEIINALQDGSTRMYLMKPWDNENLLTMIEQLLALGDIFEKKKVLEIMNSLNGLPTLPIVYNKVCTLIRDGAGIEVIAKVIEDDHIITAKVLQIANAVFYGKQTGSVKQAIVFLGLSNIKNIVLSIGIIQKDSQQHNNFLTNELLWKHASLVNKIVHLLYKKLLKKKLSSISATAGLLHDIGKVILLQNFPEQYQRVTNQVRGAKEATICDVEQTIFQVSHQEIGGFLLNWWGMPQSIIEVAVFHHTPFDKMVIDRELVGIVHIADYYSWKYLNKNMLPILEPEIFSALCIEQEDCERLIEELKRND